MSRRTLLIVGTVLTFLALLPFLARPLYKTLTVKKASPALIERTSKAVRLIPAMPMGAASSGPPGAEPGPVAIRTTASPIKATPRSGIRTP